MKDNNQPSGGNRRRRDVQDDIVRRPASAGWDMDSFYADDEEERQARARYAARQASAGRRPQSGGAQARSGSDRSRQQGNNAGRGGKRPAPNDDYQRKSKNNKRKKHTFGKVLAIIQGLLSILVLAVLFILNVVPNVYLILGAVALALLWCFAFFSQFTRKSHVAGKIEAVLISLILIFVSYYLLITQNMLSQITNLKYSVDNIVVVVMKDDPAQNLQDAADYTFGIQNTFEREKIDHTIEEINKELGKEITTQTYDSIQAQVQALYDGQVGAIIYNEGFKGTVEELFENFSVDTRTISNVEIKTKVDLTDDNKSDKKVTKEPFSVYISGNDSYGSVEMTGRSDVNMLVVVNPKTRQILLVNTPRDYYVELPGVSGGQKDKLTHAGNYGINCSMDTLEGIYGTDIDYYARVNFTSLIKMVDALGGIEVNSEYDFTAIDGRHYNKGMNYLDGESALMFARERKNVPGGDFQRGKDQQLVLMAMIKKAMSPAILTGYTGIISSLEDSFVTSMDQSDITSLIKMQLSDGGDWNIVAASATGTGDMQYCYSAMGQPLSVVVPDEASIEKVKAMIAQVYNGEILTEASDLTSN